MGIVNDKHKSSYLLLEMTSQIVSSFVSNNPVDAKSLPALIETVHASLGSLSTSPAKPDNAAKPPPAVEIKESVTPDHIICLEDGRKLKMLKRYLRSRYNMTPEEYRQRWNLPLDYPMVAPNYAKRRSEFAKEIGLGKKRRVS